MNSFDIQFRLLREDAIASLRTGIQLALDDLDSADFTNTPGRAKL